MSILNVEIYDWNVIESRQNLIAYLFGMNVVDGNDFTGTLPNEIELLTRLSSLVLCKW